MGAPGLQSRDLVLAGLGTGVGWTLLRVCVAELYELRGSIQRVRNDLPHRLDNVLIVGAGRAGLLILQEMSRHPELGQKVIGFADDALEKQAIRIRGIPVLGDSEALPRLLAEHRISLVVLAIPSAPGPVIRRFTQIVTKAGVRVKTVPGLFDLLGNQSWAPVIKDVAIEDLLRRDPVRLDQTALSLALEASVVLITGGGGSIGFELARQAAQALGTAEGAPSIVRRYREDPSPLVRDFARGWRTGRVERVLAGDFDVVPAVFSVKTNSGVMLTVNCPCMRGSS